MRARSRCGRRSRAPITRSPITSAASSPKARSAPRTSGRNSSASMPMRRRAASSCATCSSRTMAAGCRTTALLDRLVVEKLTAEAETIRAEGWKWIEVAVEFPYGHTAGLRRLTGADCRAHRGGAGQPRCAARRVRQAGGGICRGRRAARRGRPAARRNRDGSCEAFDDRPVIYDPAEIARAGVFVSIDGDGGLRIERGYVRPRGRGARSNPSRADGEAPRGSTNRRHRCSVR